MKNKEKKREYNKKYVEENNYHKKYYLENKEKLLKNSSDYRKNNTELKKETNKKYREKNKEKHNEYNKKYREQNKEKIKQYREENKEKIKQYNYEYKKNRNNNDPIFRLIKNVRQSITRSIKNKGFKKNSKSEQILGCTFEQFKEHMETQFEPWMNWDNYGKYKKDVFNYGWDIDHKTPISISETVEDVYKNNHYTNLQPLCSKVNRDIKKNKITY